MCHSALISRPLLFLHPPLNFPFSLSPPLPSFALYAPLSAPPSFPSHSSSLLLPLSSPEGMSKCMVEWRREVGLALPNSISEKLELREACLPLQSKRWPAFTVS